MIPSEIAAMAEALCWMRGVNPNEDEAAFNAAVQDAWRAVAVLREAGFGEAA